ncbi:hypothetical protein LTR36_002106 [Oleoguttula mirabilis]|uniref:Uncharacterized protein n=1 Tax=Oleoguttula mirabilis TaxID=1507867 RepID=A0AAV9JN47_9PEZI|nr:hypothetical protein LTR36_002106 [Oleoguttula mirabilis]
MGKPKTQLPGITTACKQLRDEILAMPNSSEGRAIFYSRNTFHLSLGALEELLQSSPRRDPPPPRPSSIAKPWLARIGAANARLTQTLNLPIERWRTNDSRHNDFVLGANRYLSDEVSFFVLYAGEAAAARTVTLSELRYGDKPARDGGRERSVPAITLPVEDQEAARQRVKQAMGDEARRVKQAQSDGQLTLRQYADLAGRLQQCRKQLEALVQLLAAACRVRRGE